jgi:SprT protein
LQDAYGYAFIPLFLQRMNSPKDQIKSKLERFLPNEGMDQVVDLIARHRVRFRITNPRKSKFGDYRSPDANDFHVISVNGNLNPYAFYLTTIHEFAHLIAFAKWGRSIAPHGSEWKETFSLLLQEGKAPLWFPEAIQKPLKKYIRNPKASSASDHQLYLALRQFDKTPPPLVVKDMKPGQLFTLAGRVFERGELMRKRVKCKEIQTGKLYLVNAIAEVIHIEHDEYRK